MPQPSSAAHLATGARGDDLLPKEAEAEKQRADAERTAGVRVEAELAAVRAELEALRRR